MRRGAALRSEPEIRWWNEPERRTENGLIGNQRRVGIAVNLDCQTTGHHLPCYAEFTPDRLDPDPLDFIERHLIGATIIELRRPRAGMVRHQRGVLQRSSQLP